jgi:hypothetical protein
MMWLGLSLRARADRQGRTKLSLATSDGQPPEMAADRASLSANSP